MGAIGSPCRKTPSMRERRRQHTRATEDQPRAAIATSLRRHSPHSALTQHVRRLTALAEAALMEVPALRKHTRALFSHPRTSFPLPSCPPSPHDAAAVPSPVSEHLPISMSEFLNTPNSELDEQQIRLKEEFQISQGPLSVLQSSVRNHTQILISLRNNKKLLARVKAFDRHSNMVLENVKEVGAEEKWSPGSSTLAAELMLAILPLLPFGTTDVDRGGE